jgi:F-type H+-transporting ATPase subunit a
VAAETFHHWKIALDGMPAPFNMVNMDTVMTAWFTMGLVLVIVFLIRANLKVYPSKLQVFGEGIFDVCRGITTSTAGKRGDKFLFYVGSLFIFILTANLIGQLPWRFIQLLVGYHQGELAAPTGDINTTAALAIFTLLMYFIVGIRAKGLNYFKHYLSPHWAFLPINLMEDLTRPFSLLIRLYANILVGEILTMVALSMVPFVVPVGVIFLELFVAVIQAYIFAMLSSVYISLLSAEDH